MDLSIIIPCRNAADTIGCQLDALSRQRCAAPWEVIVADNGSSDASGEIAMSFRDKLPALRLIDASRRRGAAHARNAGARAALGRALLFCDADDQAAEGWLAAMHGALQRYDFVANRMDFLALNPPEMAGIRNPQEGGLPAVSYPPYLPYAGGCGLGIKRSLHDRLGGFDESLAQLEDTDYCFRAQLSGVSLQFVPEAVMHIRFRSQAGAHFRQARLWAQFNVLMYKRYGGGEKIARAWRCHLSTWRALARNAPRLLRPETRAAWIRTLGTQVGVLHGVILHRVPPVR
jgi:glycosyltransferase involved in cell wall biosynthesis